MNDRQAAFVAAYLVHRNATKAAVVAGYSAKTASSQGERLLRNVEIRAAIDSGLARLADKLEITAERVLRERARLAFFDPRKLLDADGNPIPLQDLDADIAAAIAGVDVTTQVSDDGSVKTTIRRYRLAGKEASLSALEKRLGLDQKPIRFTLPAISDLEGCVRAQEGIIAAVAAGNILPTEGEALSRMIEAKRRAIETRELESRITALEQSR
jgi:phage terminase small subunit